MRPRSFWFLRQMIFSPWPVGSHPSRKPAARRMALLSWSRVALSPQITWPPRRHCSGVTSILRIFQTKVSYWPKPIGSPWRAIVARRMIALSSA